jgi:DnaK suppressor protein
MDEIDRANALAETRRQAAVNNVVNRYKMPQLLINDVVVCRDCNENIPLKRLKKTPDAALCVDCQAIRETRGPSYGC